MFAIFLNRLNLQCILQVKAMDQSEHAISVIAITVCNVINKLLTKIDF